MVPGAGNHYAQSIAGLLCDRYLPDHAVVAADPGYLNGHPDG